MVRRLLWWLLVTGPRRLGWAVTLSARLAGLALVAWPVAAGLGWSYLSALGAGATGVLGLYVAGWVWEAQSRHTARRNRGDRAETVGELYGRLPSGVWVELPEYGVRVKRAGEERRDG